MIGEEEGPAHMTEDDWKKLREKLAARPAESQSMGTAIGYKWIHEMDEWVTDAKIRSRVKIVDCEMHVEPVRTEGGGFRPGARLITMTVLLEEDE